MDRESFAVLRGPGAADLRPVAFLPVPARRGRGKRTWLGRFLPSLVFALSVMVVVPFLVVKRGIERETPRYLLARAERGGGSGKGCGGKYFVCPRGIDAGEGKMIFITPKACLPLAAERRQRLLLLLACRDWKGAKRRLAGPKPSQSPARGNGRRRCCNASAPRIRRRVSMRRRYSTHVFSLDLWTNMGVNAAGGSCHAHHRHHHDHARTARPDCRTG